jgi:hypothetical protein
MGGREARIGGRGCFSVVRAARLIPDGLGRCCIRSSPTCSMCRREVILRKRAFVGSQVLRRSGRDLGHPANRLLSVVCS